MEVTSLNCPNCNSSLNIEEGQQTATCPYCGSVVGINDGTVKMNVSFSNQEEAGYQFEKGRQRAQKEQFYSESAIPEKKRKTWLWVLGWIFIFPVPLTILMFNSPRTEKLDKKVRAIIVVVAWILYLIIGFGGAGNNNASTSTSTSTSTVAEQLADTSVSSNTANDEDKNTQENKYAEDDVVDAFIFSYNEISNSPFSDITEGNIRTKYHAYSYGYYCDLLNSNATNKIDVTINETDDNADDGVAGMREIFHDVMKAIDPSLADDDIYDYFDTMVTDKQSKGTLSTAEISFSPDVDYQRGHITISAQ